MSTQISDELLFEQLGYKPHSSKQQEFHDSEARFNIICCGRRFGKTTAAGRRLTKKMFTPNSINWIVAPTFPLGEKEFRVVWNDFKALGILEESSLCRKSYNMEQGNMFIEFKPLNSKLAVRSAQRPEGLVGEGLDHVCMSEAAKHSRSTWSMYIEPALSDKLGTADFPSTPEGFNWYQGLYEIGQLGINGVDEMGRDSNAFRDYASWRFPTWANEVMFPGGFDNSCEHPGRQKHDPRNRVMPCGCNAELARIKDQVSPMYWLQEYCAEFTAFEGQIYPEFSDQHHVRQFEYRKEWKNWWALDFGYVDPFICLDIMIDPSDRVWVWREYVVSYKSTHDHGLILKARENPEGFHIDAVAADPRGADEIATLTYSLGSICANAVGWRAGVEEIQRALKVREDGLPGLIIHPRCVETIRQLKRLRAKETKEEHNEKEGQHDYDDHTCDALRYFFNEYFVMGGNQSIAELYGAQANNWGKTEAGGFFKNELEGIVRLDREF